MLRLLLLDTLREHLVHGRTSCEMVLKELATFLALGRVSHEPARCST